VVVNLNNAVNRSVKWWSCALCAACARHLWGQLTWSYVRLSAPLGYTRASLPWWLTVVDVDTGVVWALAVWFTASLGLLCAIKRREGLPRCVVELGPSSSMSLLRKPDSQDDVHECLVCFDMFSVRDLVACPGTNPHYMCRDCFGGEVKAQVGETGAFAAHRQRIFCNLGCGPGLYFRHEVVVQSINSEAREAFYAAKQRVALQQQEQEQNSRFRAMDEELTRVRTRTWQELHSRFQAMDEARVRQHATIGATAIVSQHVRHILNEILVYKCPGCVKPFVFNREDCAAVKCNECNIFFCAWCLVRCNDSPHAHNHVRQCTDNPTNNVYPRDYERDKGIRIGRLVREYLARRVEQPHREAIKEQIKPHLQWFDVQV